MFLYGLDGAIQSPSYGASASTASSSVAIQSASIPACAKPLSVAVCVSFPAS
jgi:hypothetical protein